MHPVLPNLLHFSIRALVELNYEFGGLTNAFAGVQNTICIYVKNLIKRLYHSFYDANCTLTNDEIGSSNEHNNVRDCVRV